MLHNSERNLTDNTEGGKEKAMENKGPQRGAGPRLYRGRKREEEAEEVAEEGHEEEKENEMITINQRTNHRGSGIILRREAST